MSWQKNLNPNKYRTNQIVLSIILLVLLCAVGVGVWIFTHNPQNDQSDIQTNDSNSENLTRSNDEPPETVKLSAFDAGKIQAAVTSWNESLSGKASVVTTESDGVLLNALEPDEPFFAASLYKLYVAYEGYRQVDNKEVDPSEDFLQGFTRAECLDKMIRESDSPCAEKLMAEIGPSEITEKLRTYGINNTSMVAITTTAGDVARILSRIATGEGLSGESQSAFLTSMKNQIFRDSLNKGFSQDVVVYNKIGFRELVEYHDAAIVEFPDGRQLIVVVMTENVGTTKIAELGRLLEQAISTN